MRKYLSVPKDSGVVSSSCRPSLLACSLFRIASCSEEVWEEDRYSA